MDEILFREAEAEAEAEVSANGKRVDEMLNGRGCLLLLMSRPCDTSNYEAIYVVHYVLYSTPT